ncbi:MAG: nuclear transport factor 2 family protein, partial [Actinomycetota bacterium]
MDDPGVVMIFEGRVLDGGRDRLQAFYSRAHTHADGHRSMAMSLKWDAEDDRRFRAVFEYATEQDFVREDFRSLTGREAVEYRHRLDELVEGSPVVRIWRETSRQVGHDLVRAYWDLVDGQEWDALGAILAPDVVLEWPAANRRLVGAGKLIAANRDDRDGWNMVVRSIVAEGEEVASDVEQVLDNGDWFRVVTFWTVRHHRIVGGTEFRTGRRAAPAPMALDHGGNGG